MSEKCKAWRKLMTRLADFEPKACSQAHAKIAYQRLQAKQPHLMFWQPFAPKPDSPSRQTALATPAQIMKTPFSQCIESPNAWLKRLSLGLLALLLAMAYSSQIHAQTGSRKIEGQWENGAATYLYKFEILFEPKEAFEGYIQWTLLKSPREAEKGKIGLQGKEFVKGRYIPATRKLLLKGYQKEDPHNIIGLDEYRLELSSDGKHLFGTTKGGGEWDGKLDSRVNPEKLRQPSNWGIADSGTTATRFIESKHKAWVLDLATGLVWDRCFAGQNFHDGRCHQKPIKAYEPQAKSIASQRIPGGRLPNTFELTSLANCNTKGRSIFALDGSSTGTPVCKEHPHEIDTKIIPAFVKTHINDKHLIWTTDSFTRVWRGDQYKYFYYIEAQPNYMSVMLEHPRWGFEIQVLSVSDISNPQIQSQFESTTAENLRHLEQKINPTLLTWTSQAGVAKLEGQVTGLPTPPSIKTSVLIKTAALAAEYKSRTIPRPQEPTQIQYKVHAILSPKGEFETSAQYRERTQQAEAIAQAESHQRFEKAMAQYQVDMEAYQKAEFNQAQNLASELFLQEKLLEAWTIIAANSLGDPLLTDIRYDADQQEFIAKLWGSKGRFIGDVRSPVPVAQARKLKPDLESGKIAPKVTFDFPSMSISWELVENTALRAARFKEASSSISSLESLLGEFPNAPESKAARARIARLIAEEFKRANDDRSKLETLVAQYPQAPEVAGAKRRIDQLRTEEQRQARESEEASRRQREWENSPQGQAKRQATQLCEAQKNTCFSQCGEASYWNGSRWVENQSWSGCRSRCGSISCY